jgi:hypothetical protein
MAAAMADAVEVHGLVQRIVVKISLDITSQPAFVPCHLGFDTAKQQVAFLIQWKGCLAGQVTFLSLADRPKLGFHVGQVNIPAYIRDQHWTALRPAANTQCNEQENTRGPGGPQWFSPRVRLRLHFAAHALHLSKDA